MTGQRDKWPPRRPGAPQAEPGGAEAPTLRGSHPARHADHRVLQGFAALRAERVFGESRDCPQCAAAREADADADALCDRHLGEALGVQGGWDLGGPGRKL